MVAELGKARRVEVNKLQAGMKVQEPVKGRGGKILVNAGEILTEKHCKQLNKWEKREKPQGPVLARKDPKDKREAIRHAEFVGGYRPSHFNPNGILVTATTASGEEVPEVERDPLKSLIRNDTPQKSFASADVGIESPAIRCKELEAGIKILEETNKQLGGDYPEGNPVTEEELIERTEGLKKQNAELLSALKGSPKKPGRPNKKKGFWK